jgi:hypothetical protein
MERVTAAVPSGVDYIGKTQYPPNIVVSLASWMHQPFPSREFNQRKVVIASVFWYVNIMT